RLAARRCATLCHTSPTVERKRPFLDVVAEDMIASLERNCRDFGVRLAGLDDDRQGIVHVIGPELGLTQPGMTIACGDSHTSTHGAFGSVAFGIGTSQVRDVLASQCLSIEPLKVRRIRVSGTLHRGVYAKDVILEIIQRLGVRGGTGYAYEYAGDTVDHMTIDERMTLWNTAIARCARVGYVNPDETTFEYLEGRPFSPQGDAFGRARQWWRSIASDADATFDDDVVIRAEELKPVVTWGVNPGQSIAIDEQVPAPDESAEPQAISDALDYMGLEPGRPIAGMKVDVAFIGSCTTARLSDLREAARIVKGRHVAPGVKALVVPGSVAVSRAAEREGLADVFRAAGFAWRGVGCSMCLCMNPDKLEGNQVCAASSNRNFKGRQGS